MSSSPLGCDFVTSLLLKLIANLKSQTIKNVKNTVAKILTLLTELFSMSPNTPNKNSLNFLSDYYFDTKSPVAFTNLLALYEEAKKRYPSLTFRQVNTWLQSKDTYTLHKPVRYNFPRNRVIVTGIDDQWQADLVDVSSLARFNKGYKGLVKIILLPVIALSFPHFCPKLEQTLHIHQGQHS